MELKLIFVFQLLNSDHRSTATVQICSGSVNLKGAVKCRAYIHSSKPKVKDAVQVQKDWLVYEKQKQVSDTFKNPEILSFSISDFRIINLILTNKGAICCAVQLYHEIGRQNFIYILCLFWRDGYTCLLSVPRLWHISTFEIIFSEEIALLNNRKSIQRQLLGSDL